MKEVLAELFSDVDGLSPSEVMGFLSGVSGIVLAFMKNNQSATVLAFAAGCFGLNKAASAVVKTQQSKAVQVAMKQPAPTPTPANIKTGPSVPVTDPAKGV